MTRAASSNDGRTVVHVVGARPNFPKAAPVITALTSLGIRQRLVHTGQHYDDRLSDAFFRELNLPSPDVNLGIGSGTHAVQTAALMVALEAEFTHQRPTLLLVYGDINSTIAAALVAAKLGIPVAHVEAGLRSFDRTMPEEVNRVVTDQLADLLFVTSAEAIDNLRREGVADSRIHFVGNPMIDTLLANIGAFDPAVARAKFDLGDSYVVATLHRPGNVDDPKLAGDVVAAIGRCAGLVEVVIPLHPRGREALVAAGLASIENVRVVDPLSYLDFMSLVLGSEAVITDSGGVQEETTVLGIPCLTLRPNTERPVTITHGTNRLVTTADLAERLDVCLQAKGSRGETEIPPLWDGKAGGRIAAVVSDWICTQ